MISNSFELFQQIVFNVYTQTNHNLGLLDSGNHRAKVWTAYKLDNYQAVLNRNPLLVNSVHTHRV